MDRGVTLDPKKARASSCMNSGRVLKDLWGLPWHSNCHRIQIHCRFDMTVDSAKPKVTCTNTYSRAHRMQVQFRQHGFSTACLQVCLL